jgi:hypothetical protein
LTAIWDVKVYSAYTKKRVARVHAEGNNFSYIAQALYRALKKGTAANEELLAQREGGRPAPAQAAAPAPAAETPWWKK